MWKVLHTSSGNIASTGTLQIQSKKADKVKLRLLNLYRKSLDEDLNNGSMHRKKVSVRGRWLGGR